MRAQAHQGRSEPKPSNSLMGGDTVGVKVDAAKQWMMIGAKHPRTPILGVLVQPMDPGLPNESGTVPHQKVVQHQPGQGMEGMAPRRRRRRDPEGVSGVGERPPRLLVPAAAKVEVGAEHHRAVRYRTDQMASLALSPRGAQPAVTRGTAGVEVCTDYPKSPTPQRELRRDRNPALQDQRQLDRMSVDERQRRENGVAPVAWQHPVSHRGRIAEIHPLSPSGFDHVLLGAQLRGQNSSSGTRGDWWKGRVASIGFLDQDQEREIRLCAETLEISLADT